MVDPALRGAHVLCTLGYEGRTLDDVVDLLARHHVEVLVDVRGTPRSRKPGLSKTRLAEAVSELGAEYRHERRLGVPREDRAAFRSGDDAAVTRYRQRLVSQEKAVVRQVIDLAGEQMVALLCFEHEEAGCHRRVVAELVTAHDPTIEHIAL